MPGASLKGRLLVATPPLVDPNFDGTVVLMLEHGEEANYLSIFDPRTIEHYDHFYKALAEHFGDKIDAVYACILGPYGEGNYPLYVPDWVNMGHCHEGYWCGDAHALKAHRSAMGFRCPEMSRNGSCFTKTPNPCTESRPRNSGLQFGSHGGAAIGELIVRQSR